MDFEPRSADAARVAPPSRSTPRVELRALVPAPPWRRGALDVEADGSGETGPGAAPTELKFEVVRVHEGIAELRITGPSLNLRCVLDALAAAGLPVLGDLERGGLRVPGGVRLCDATAGDLVEAERMAWPDPAVFPSRDSKGRPPVLRVSRQTARVIERGHPWILPDRESDDPAGYAPGSLVEVVGPRGGNLGLAVAEGGRIGARMWARGVAKPRDAESVEARVARALRRRRPLLEPHPDAPVTDAFRLVHGEADGLPGLVIDRLGSVVRVLVSGRAAEGFRARAVDAILRALVDRLGAEPSVVEVIHVLPRPTGRMECVTLETGPDPERVCVRERGLVFRVDPGLGEPTRSAPGVGLFLDQRDNRERVAKRAAHGGRWLNLFAHTGAFSVALLAAGADRVDSVDLSPVYLRWLQENLELNQCDGARHRSIRGDGREFLERAGRAAYDGIILDPPTAAAGGRGFWSLRGHFGPLIVHALTALRPGAALLVSRNDRRRRASLASIVTELVEEARIDLESLVEAPAGLDFPRSKGFFEGDPFDAVLATRAR